MIKITGTQNNNLRIRAVLFGEVFNGKLDLDHRVVSFYLDEDYTEDFLLSIIPEIAKELNEYYECFDKDSAEWYEVNFFYYDEDFNEWNTHGLSGLTSNGW